MFLRSWINTTVSLLFLAVLFCLFSPSVYAQQLDTDNLLERTLVHEHLKRKYYIYAPQGYDPGKPIPLVLVFHRYQQSAKEIAKVTGFNTIAEKYNFLIAYPEAYKGNWNDGRKVSWLHGYNDSGFVNKLVHRLEQKWNVDRTRVYATGLGNGGFFAQSLALNHPDKIAAVASVAASLPKIVVSKKRPIAPVSVLLILGDKDPVVPFGGGLIGKGVYRRTRGIAVSASQAVSYWVGGNKCGQAYQEGTLPDLDPTDETQVNWIHYRDCAGESEVILFAVMGGGHTWPGSRKDHTAKKFGLTCMDFNASMEIWRFFSKHQLAGLR